MNISKAPVMALIHFFNQFGHTEERIVFASRNEKALLSLKERLNLFCHKDQSFDVREVGCGYPKIVDNKFKVMREHYSDYTFSVFIDDYAAFELPHKLDQDERIVDIELCSNPKISEINSLCYELWNFNDFHKTYHLLKRIEKAKANGDFYQNPEKWKPKAQLLCLQNMFTSY